MTRLAILQILSSFLLGGAIVALQAYAAERVPQKISGIILALPSTIIVNYFFLFQVLGAEGFSHVLPLIPAPLGLSLILIAVYIYMAKWISMFFKAPKLILIFICTIVSSAIWLAISVPLAIYKFDNVSLSIVIFVLLAFLSQLILNRGSAKYRQVQTVHYTWVEQLTRAVFAGLMVAATVYFAKILGPFWGGIMAVFPAAFLSTIVIIHHYYSHEALFGFFKSAPLGTTTLIIYAVIAHFCFPVIGVAWGTLLCVAISYAYSWLLST